MHTTGPAAPSDGKRCKRPLMTRRRAQRCLAMAKPTPIPGSTIATLAPRSGERFCPNEVSDRRPRVDGRTARNDASAETTKPTVRLDRGLAAFPAPWCHATGRSRPRGYRAPSVPRKDAYGPRSGLRWTASDGHGAPGPPFVWECFRRSGPMPVAVFSREAPGPREPSTKLLFPNDRYGRREPSTKLLFPNDRYAMRRQGDPIRTYMNE